MNPLEQYHWIAIASMVLLGITAGLIHNLSEKTSNLLLIILIMIPFAVILNEGLKYGLKFQIGTSVFFLVILVYIAIKEIKSGTV